MSNEQVFREALARIGAGFYTEAGAERHAKDIIRLADSQACAEDEIEILKRTCNSLSIGYEARGGEIELLKRERAAPAGPRDGLPNDAGNTAGSQSPASPRAAGTEHDWSQFLHELANVQVKQQIATHLRQVASQLDELLAACKALMPEGWDEGHMDHMPGIKFARVAIAKAEGRS